MAVQGLPTEISHNRGCLQGRQKKAFVRYVNQAVGQFHVAFPAVQARENKLCLTLLV